MTLLVFSGFTGCVESDFIVRINGPSQGTINEEFVYNVSIQGGTGPYIYAWDLDNDGEFIDSNNETVVFTPTSGGIHIIKVRVTDKNGRQGEANITLSLPLTEANWFLKSMTFNPIYPIEKENIDFNLILENIGDNKTPIMSLGLNWTHRNGKMFSSWRKDLFSFPGRSENNVTLATGINTTNEGLQSFKIVYYDFQRSEEIILKIVNIDIEPLPPEIYLVTTIGNYEGPGDYPEKIIFDAGETVYVYIEYRNVNHDDFVDVHQSITVHQKYSSFVYYSNTRDFEEINESDDWVALWNFPTYDTSNGNWPTGIYQVDLEILDKITEKTTTESVFFTIE